MNASQDIDLSDGTPVVTDRAIERREEILRVATTLFSERGFAATNLQMIADEIGFTKPAIYNYFDSKDQILFEIHDRTVRDGLVRVRRIRDEGGDPTSQLRKVLTEHVLSLLGDVDAHRVFSLEQAALSFERAESIRKRERSYDREVREIYENGMAQGFFRRTDPLIAVGCLLAACNWLHDWFTEGGEYSPDDVATMVVAFLAEAFEA